jgi:uncharacterized phage protein gp47/JayE
MSFDTPDLRTLNTRAQADIEAELPGTNARLRRSNLNVLAKVMAMIGHGFYKFIREFLDQCLPWSKGFLLRQWAEIWKVFSIPATFAQGSVNFTGTNDSPIVAGTLLLATDGRQYSTLSDVTIASGVATVDVIALVAGQVGNVAAGIVLAPATTIGGVSSTVTVGVDGITGGTDDESVDSFYSRYVQKVQNPPHGGNKEDYVGWAREVAGVTRAWAFGNLDGINTVQLYFVRDNDVMIIPDSTEIAAVSAYVSDPSRKPITVMLNVYAPVPRVHNFTIHVVPDTPAVRAATETELRDVISREADLGGTIALSHFEEGISLAEGETDHTMTVPSSPIVCAANEIATFGAITWI